LLKAIKSAQGGTMGSRVEIGCDGRELGHDVGIDVYGPFEDAEPQHFVQVTWP
jgi:hypothetical protein